jgi:hypothetical protein
MTNKTSKPQYKILRTDLIKSQEELEELLKKDGALELLLSLSYIE